jgi:hypothetical protein
MFVHELNDLGVHTVADIKRENLHKNEDALTAIGFRKIQIAKLRRALQVVDQPRPVPSLRPCFGPLPRGLSRPLARVSVLQSADASWRNRAVRGLHAFCG